MKFLNQIFNILFLLASIFMCVASLKLGIGELNSPGSGFMPFLTSIFLFSLSLIMVAKKIKSTNEGVKKKAIITRKNLINLIILIVSLFGYAFFLNIFGYLITTFLLMFMMLVIFDPKKWLVYIFIAAVTVNLSFLFFDKWLQVQLPIGIFHVTW